MNYQKDKEYNIKYATTNGETKEVKFTPEKDMNTPEIIMKLKTDNKDFFKLLEEDLEKKEYPKKIKTRDGYVLTKVNDGTPENAGIPEYMNEYGDCVLISDPHKYLKVEENIEKLVEESDNNTITSEIGFYIGDPCYVLSDEIYDKMFDEETDFKTGKVKVDDNFSFIVHSTAWGDGEYFDNSGISYGVDSGTLSVIPIELLENNEFIEEGEYEYGRIIFGKTASLNYEDGTFYFNIDNDNVKEVVIDTDPEEPEDDNWDDDEFPEDYWNNEDIYNDEEEDED